MIYRKKLTEGDSEEVCSKISIECWRSVEQRPSCGDKSVEWLWEVENIVCKRQRVHWICSFILRQWIQEVQLLLWDRATRRHAKDSWNGRGNDNLGWNDLQMYFKVIKSGTNRKLVYDFLLVVYSNFCRITQRFWEIWYETVRWPWNMPKDERDIPIN